MSSLEIAPTTDADLIRSIITHPEVYPWVSDDFAPPVERFRVASSGWSHLVVRHMSGEVAGCFCFQHCSPVMWEVHTCLLPEHRRGTAREAGRLAMEWLKKNSGIDVLITHVPGFNRAARVFAADMGLERWGAIPDGFRWRGKAYTLYLMGVSLCQQRAQLAR